MGTRIGTKIGQGAPGTAFIEYDLSANFNSAANQTFTNAQVLNTAEEGVDYGSLTVVDSGAGTVKVVSNELELVGTGNINETGVFGSTATTKALGKALFLTYTPSNVSERDYFGFVNTAGLDIGNNPESIFYHRDSGEVRVVNPATAATLGVATLAASTEYKIAWLLGGTDSGGVAFKTGDTVGDFLYGSRILLKGGTYTNWTLLWLMSTGNTSSLYAQAQLRNATAVTLDNILIPTNVLDVDTMFQPNFLDTFAGDNDDQLVSAHTPEVVGGATGTGNPWESGSTTWTIQSNTANNNPGLDSDVAPTNTATSEGSEADATTSWTNDGMATFESTAEGTEPSGTWSLHLVADGDGDQAYTSATTVVGRPYKVTVTYKKNAATDGSALRISNSAGSSSDGLVGLNSSSWTSSITTFTAIGTTTYFTIREGGAGDDAEIWIDVLKVEPVTLDELILTDDMEIDEGIFDIDGTIAAKGDGSVGIVSHLDSYTSPANGVLAYYNRLIGKAQLFKLVAGAGTSLINTTATYAAGGKLRVIAYESGTDLKVRLYYNGALIGTEQTISDAGIVGNTRHGILSVDSSNSLANFVVYPRTNSNWDTEISNATGGVY